MARVVVRAGAVDQLMNGYNIRQALEDTAGKVQAEAARINAVEAVDTGLMTASWRVRAIPSPKGWVARVINLARSEPPDRFPYPYVIEHGWRTKSGRHIPGKHILARSIDAVRR